MALSLLLDTNICIALLTETDGKVKSALFALPEGAAAVCSVVRAELIFGAENSARVVENLAKVDALLSPFESLPFDDRAADWYGSIRAHLRAKGTPVGPNDLMIAAIALANGLGLATRNVSEFRRVPGLKVVRW